MLPPDIHDLSRKVIEAYKSQEQRIVTAESCTGGLLAGALTEIPGSSDVLERGFVSYSNDSKVEVLGVLPDILEEFGAVSAETAEAMAQGALEFSRADVAISVTGIAGPSGGTLNKPVGLVFFGVASRAAGSVFHYRCHFKGERDDIRMQAVKEALRLLTTAQ
jgi:nicotinamide-nucleotide amidase